MKKFRILSLILALTLVLASVSTAAYAAAYTEEDMGTPSFVYGSPEPAYSAVKTANPSYIDNGTWTDTGLFKSGWYHTQAGSSGNSYNNNYHQYVFDTAKVFGENYSIKEGDVIYLSFYIKNETSFDFGGTTYNGQDKPTTINIKLGGNNTSKGKQMLNLSAYDTSNKRYHPYTYTPADGQWHKLSYGLYVDSGVAALDAVKTAGQMTVTIDFTTMNENYSVKFADFTIGKMNFDSSKTYSETTPSSRGLDYLTYMIDNTAADAKYISADGFITPVVSENGEKVYEYDTAISSESPEITVSNSTKGSFVGNVMESEYTKSGDSVSLVAYAPAYDKTQDSSYNAKYVQAEDYTITAGASQGVKSIRTSAYPNSRYTESYTLGTKGDYKVFAPNGAYHNLGSGNDKYRNTYVVFNGNNVTETALTDDTFKKGYVMQLLKSDAGYDSLTKDVHYYQFDYNTDGFADTNDIIMYSMYVKVESDLTSGYAPVFKMYGNVAGTGSQFEVTGKNSAYMAIQKNQFPASDEAFMDGKWHKITFACNASDSSNPYIRVAVPRLDGKANVKITVAEPRLSVIKLASSKVPDVEKRTNNQRVTYAADYAQKADIIGVKANGTYIPLNSDGTVDVPSVVKPEDVTAVSTYGDLPCKVELNSQTGKYELTAYSLIYDPTVTSAKISNIYNRRASKYTYSDSSTTTVFDYEKSLDTPVTAISGYTGDARQLDNITLSPVVINITTGTNITVDLKKDGASVKSQADMVPAAGGSTYELSVSCAYFTGSESLIFAAVDSNGRLVNAGVSEFASDGTASVTFGGITSSANIAKLKAYIWDMANGQIIPVTEPIVLGSSEVGYSFPKVIER